MLNLTLKNKTYVFLYVTVNLRYSLLTYETIS